MDTEHPTVTSSTIVKQETQNLSSPSVLISSSITPGSSLKTSTLNLVNVVSTTNSPLNFTLLEPTVTETTTAPVFVQNVTTSIPDNSLRANFLKSSELGKLTVRVSSCEEKLMLNSEYKNEPLRNVFKILCYGSSGTGSQVNVITLNPFLCTHLIYGSVKLNHELDYVQESVCGSGKNYQRQFETLKSHNSKLKILLSVSEWDSLGRNSSITSFAPKAFVNQTLSYLTKHSFDGINFEWKVLEKLLNHKIIKSSQLFRQLKKALGSRLLSATIEPLKVAIENIKELSEFDYVNAITFDYVKSESKYALNHAALHSFQDTTKSSNGNFSIHWLISQGLSPSKLLFGIPFYGRSFTLLDSSSADIGSFVIEAGAPGRTTKKKGILSYAEICNNIIKLGWLKRVDSLRKNGLSISSGPYAYQGDQWVGYDDKNSVVAKAKFIKKLKLAGAMIKFSDLDDISGSCCNVKYPLLKTLNKELRGLNIDTDFFCP